MGIMDTDEDNGAGRRKRPRRGRRPTRGTRKVKTNPFVTQTVGALAHANAGTAAGEAMRPNRIHGLLSGTAIAAGATESATITLADETYVSWVGCANTDSEKLVCTEFIVNNFNVVGTGPINLGSFVAFLQRMDRFTPLIGRRFTNGVTIKVSLKNPGASSVTCLGINVHVQEPICERDRKGSAVAPGVLGFGNLRRIIGSGAGKAGTSLRRLFG